MVLMTRVCIYQDGKLKGMSLPQYDYRINGVRSKMFIRMNKGKYRYRVLGKRNIKIEEGIRCSRFTYWRPITYIELD